MLSCAMFIIYKCYNVLCSRVQLLDLVLYCPAIAQTTGTHNFDKFTPFTHLVYYKKPTKITCICMTFITATEPEIIE